MSTTKKPLIFLHVPCAAGCKFMGALRRKFNENSICRIVANESVTRKRGKMSIAEFKNLSQEERDKIKLLMGHMSFGIHEDFSSLCDYVTLLREPVSRTISQYYYISTKLDHDDYDKVSKMTLEEYAVSSMAGANNFQTRMISANHEFSSVDIFPLPANALEVAKKNLREYFKVVGVVEKFHESLFAVKKAFSWNNVYYDHSHNHSNPKRPKNSEISLATREAIAKNNALDLELYSYAEKLLNESIKAYGSNLNLDIAKFEKTNEFLDKMGVMRLEENFWRFMRRVRKFVFKFI